jgi:hypothetical protein
MIDTNGTHLDPKRGKASPQPSPASLSPALPLYYSSNIILIYILIYILLLIRIENKRRCVPLVWKELAFKGL